MNLISQNEKYNSTFNVYQENYVFDRIDGSSDMSELVRFFEKRDFCFQNVKITCNTNGTNTGIPICCETIKDFLTKWDTCDTSSAQRIDFSVQYRGNSVMFVIFPQNATLLIERVIEDPDERKVLQELELRKQQVFPAQKETPQKGTPQKEDICKGKRHKKEIIKPFGFNRALVANYLLLAAMIVTGIFLIVFGEYLRGIGLLIYSGIAAVFVVLITYEVKKDQVMFTTIDDGIGFEQATINEDGSLSLETSLDESDNKITMVFKP